VEWLLAWGVDIIFGLPGDGIKAEGADTIHPLRHEEAGAFMVCAYAKFTGRLGLCIATSGPRGIHLLNVTIARGAGIDAFRIEDAATCSAQLDGVVSRLRPVLIEAVVDQFTPLMPAKIKASQALKLAEALVLGEPNSMKIALTSAHDKVRELV
jgi:thiamine pyrophosphate-dependent acetolactate synthase large subunit-like protein